MKVLHTSDWHLGRTLYGRKRYDEFDAYLTWLLETIRKEQVDVLIVAGDIFDTTTPTNRAQEQYYRFLGNVRSAGCRHIVVVAGNHDSPTFLDAPAMLLRSMGVHVIGATPENIEDEVIVICDDKGTTQLVVCAVPYLRERDLRRVEPGETEQDRQRKVTEGIAEHYQRVLTAARARLNSGARVPIVATGHLFASGAVTVEGDGVRELYVGTLAHFCGTSFPDGFDYVALGHLHVPQLVGKNPRIRYSGSPLPMGVNEASQQKEVVLLEWHDDHFDIGTLLIPRFQQLALVSGDWDAIEAGLAALIAKNESVWVEVDYTGDALMPDLKEQTFEKLNDTVVEVLRIRNQRVFNQVLQRIDTHPDLNELGAEEVFRRRLALENTADEVTAELEACYREILAQVLESDVNAE